MTDAFTPEGRQELLSRRELLVRFGAEVVEWAAQKPSELLKEMKESGQRSDGGRGGSSHDTTTLSDLGISRDQSSRWQQNPEPKAKPSAPYRAVRKGHPKMAARVAALMRASARLDEIRSGKLSTPPPTLNCLTALSSSEEKKPPQRVTLPPPRISKHKPVSAPEPQILNIQILPKPSPEPDLATLRKELEQRGVLRPEGAALNECCK